MPKKKTQAPKKKLAATKKVKRTYKSRTVKPKKATFVAVAAENEIKDTQIPGVFDAPALLASFDAEGNFQAQNLETIPVLSSVHVNELSGYVTEAEEAIRQIALEQEPILQTTEEKIQEFLQLNVSAAPAAISNGFKGKISQTKDSSCHYCKEIKENLAELFKSLKSKTAEKVNSIKNSILTPRAIKNAAIFTAKQKIFQLKYLTSNKVTILRNTNAPLTFAPLHLIEGLAVSALVFTSLVLVGNILFPPKNIPDNLIIKTAQIKQTSAVIVGQTEKINWTVLVSRKDITGEHPFLKLPKNAENIQVKTVSREQVELALNDNSAQNPSSSLTLRDRRELANLDGQKKNTILNMTKYLLAGLGVGNGNDKKDEVPTVQTSDATIVDVSQANNGNHSGNDNGNGNLTDNTTSTTSPIDNNGNGNDNENGSNNGNKTKDNSLAETTTQAESPVQSGSGASGQVIQQTNTDEYVEVTYQTKGPIITEKKKRNGKEVTVSIPDEVFKKNGNSKRQIQPTPTVEQPSVKEEKNDKPNKKDKSTEKGEDKTSSLPEQASQAAVENLLTPTETPPSVTNVLAHTNLPPKLFKVGQESKIQIKWKNNGNQSVDFQAYDLDNNGYLDYVEWTIPHLSEQIFDIIFISKAFQLDPLQDVVEDIYDQVSQIDGVSSIIPTSNYVRATFQLPLSYVNDITVRAKPVNENALSRIEIYPVYTDADGNQTEGPLAATSDYIDKDGTYKTVLHDLAQPTDVFDLKIVGGDLDIDFIVDPVTYTATRVWDGGGTTNNWSDCNNWSGNVCPTASDVVQFDSTSPKDVVVDVNINVSGFNTTAAYSGSIDFGTSQIDGTVGNGAVQFNAADKSHLRIADVSQTGLDPGTSDFSIAFWVYIDTLTDARVLISKMMSEAGYEIYVNTNGAITAQLGDGTKVYPTSAAGVITTGQWYFIAYNADRDGNLTVSVNNGAPVITADISARSGSMDNTELFKLGANATPAYFHNGRLDSMGFWNRLLTVDELTYLYNLGTGRVYSDIGTTGTNGSALKTNLVSWWDLNENAGVRYDSHGTNHLSQSFTSIIAPPIYGNELLANGGFETAGAGGADVFGTWTEIAGSGVITDETTVFHGSSHSIKLTTGGTLGQYAEIVQYPTLTPGATYRLSFWAYGDGANASLVGIWDGTHSSYIANLASVSTTAAWTLVTMDFTAPAGCTSGGPVFLSPSAANGYAYFDDVSVKQITTAALNNGGFETLGAGQTLGSELIASNTGFETYTGTQNDGVNDTFSGWGTNGTTGYVVDAATTAHSGTNAAKLVSGSGLIVNLNKSFAVTSSARYKLTFWTAGDGTHSGAIQVYDNTNSANITSNTSTGVTANGIYSQYTLYFTVPSNSTSITVYLNGTGVNGGYAYYDDVSLKRVTADAPFANWATYITGSSSVNSETNSSNIYAGNYAARFDVDSSNSYVTVYQSIGTAGKLYSYSVVAKGDSGAPSIQIETLSSAGNMHTLNTTYTTYSGTIRFDGAYFGIKRNTATGKSVYLDNITLSAAEILGTTGIPRGQGPGVDYAAQLNGTSQYFNYAGTSFNPGIGDFSVGGAFSLDKLPAGSGTEALLMSGDWGNGNQYFLATINASGQVVIQINDGSTPLLSGTSTNVVSPGNWYTLIVNFDRDGNAVAYVNNSAWVTLAIGTRAGAISPGTFGVGAQPTGSNNFPGRINGAFYANRLLTANEISYLNNNGHWRRWPDLGIPGTNGSALTSSVVKGWYDFDTAGALGNDASGNNNTLTNTGTVTQGVGQTQYAGGAIFSFANPNTIDFNGATINVTDATIDMSGAGTVAPGTGTTTFYGTSTIIPNTFPGLSLYNVTVPAGSYLNQSTTGYVNSGTLSLSGYHNINSGTLNTANLSLNSGGTLTTNNNPISITGNWTNAGTYTGGTSTVTLAGTGLQTLTTGGTAFYDLIQNGSGGTYTLQDPLTVTNNLTLTAGTLDTRAGSNHGITVTGNWTNNGGTFAPQNGTVTFSGSGTQTLDAGGTGAGKHFNNVIFSGSGTLQPTTSDIQIDGTLALNAGAGIFDNATNNKSITMLGDVTMANSRVDVGAGAWTFGGNLNYSGVGTWNTNIGQSVIFTGNGKTIAAKAYGDFYNTTIAGGASISTTVASFRMLGNTTVYGTLSIGAAGNVEFYGLRVKPGGRVTGAGTAQLYGTDFFEKSGVFDPATTIFYSGFGSLPAGTIESPSVAFYAYAPNYTWNLSFSAGTTTFDGNVLFRANGSGTVLNIKNDSNNPNLVFKGNVTIQQTAGTLNWTKGAGTITLSGTGNQTINLAGRTVEDFNINKPTSGAVTWTSGDTINLAGASYITNFTVPSGVTINGGTGTLNVSGNFSRSGTFNANNGTVVFNGTSQTVSNSSTFNNLSFTAPQTVNFTSGTTQTINGDVTCQGVGASLITIGATSSSQANLSKASGTVNCNYLNLSYSNATGGATWNAGANSINGGNNSGWFFDTTAPATSISGNGYIFGTQANAATVKVSLSCLDSSGYGCDKTYYCLDQTNTCSPSLVYSSPVVVSTPGTIYVRYNSTDLSGNSETVSSEQVMINEANVGGSTNTAQGGGNQISVPSVLTQNPITQLVSEVTNVIQQINQPSIVAPPISESVPEKAPTALQGLRLMTVNPLGKFGLVQTNTNVISFADKVPQLKKALDALAINANKLDDIKKLAGKELYLPGLTQTVLTKTEIAKINKYTPVTAVPTTNQAPQVQVTPQQLPGGQTPSTEITANKGEQNIPSPQMEINQFASVQGVPLAGLGAAAIAKMPTDIVFARTAGELIDLTTAISVNKDGKVEQKINTISGRQIELVIKPESPAKRVSGLVALTKAQNTEAKPRKDIFSAVLGAALSQVVQTTTTQNPSTPAGLLLQKFEYDEVKPGVFKATINTPENEGEYEIVTVVEYKDKALSPTENHLTAVVDPEGYVYKQTPDGRLRIQNAKVSIYWLNTETNKFELWPAEKFLQKNPVFTDETGKYSFLVPQGTYYMTASAENYLDYKSDEFTIKEDNGVRMDIELKKKTFLPEWLGWNGIIAVLLLMIVVMLGVIITWVIRKNITKVGN